MYKSSPFDLNQNHCTSQPLAWRHYLSKQSILHRGYYQQICRHVCQDCCRCNQVVVCMAPYFGLSCASWGTLPGSTGPCTGSTWRTSPGGADPCTESAPWNCGKFCDGKYLPIFTKMYRSKGTFMALARFLSSESELELPDALRWRVGLAAFADMDAFWSYGASLQAVSDSHRLQGLSDGCHPEGRHQK